MDLLKKQDRVKRFSEGVSPELKHKVVMISARFGDSFRTRAFQNVSDAEKGNHQNCEWREAIKDDATGLWSVRQYKTVQGLYMDVDGNLDQEPSLKQSTLLSGACFFDALHVCALFEAGEGQGGLNRAAVGEGLDDLGLTHYKAFAEREGILFDKETNLPVPVADGHILADDCVLDLKAPEIAARAKGNLQVPKAENMGEAARSHTDNLPAIIATHEERVRQSVNNSVALVKSHGALEKMHKRQVKKLDGVKDTFGQVSDSKGALVTTKIYDGFEAVGLTGQYGGAALFGIGVVLSTPPLLMIGGIVGGIGVMLNLLNAAFEDRNVLAQYSENKIIMPNQRFDRQLKQMRRYGQRQGDPALRDAYAVFADKAEMAHRKLTARYAFQRAAQGKGFFADAKVKRTLTRLVQTAARTGMKEHEINLMIEKLRDNPESSSYQYEAEGDFSDAVRGLNRSLREYKERQVSGLKQLPSPQ